MYKTLYLTVRACAFLFETVVKIDYVLRHKTNLYKCKRTVMGERFSHLRAIKLELITKICAF